MTKSFRLSASLALLALALSFADAYDPGPLQDICVAVNAPNNALFVNGMFCKNPALTTANDFHFTGLQVPRSTANPLGSTVSPVFVDQLPALNTLGTAMARIDIGIGGLNPPHMHPRASEIFLVLEGTLYAGFVTSNQLNSTLFEKVLQPGDVFVFPIGMIHFQLNVGKTNAVAIAAFSSQNPGIITVANALFNAKPSISPEVLAKGFQLDEKLVEELQKKFCIYYFEVIVINLFHGSKTQKYSELDTRLYHVRGFPILMLYKHGLLITIAISAKAA